MTRFWTADLHLGHANIIRYSGRPFASVDAMNQALIERWNDTVRDRDEVWVLGDVAMGKIDESLVLVTQLRGHKVLVAGNHDRCWSGHGAKAEPWLDRYRRAGFDEIRQGSISASLGATEVLCCHFPYRGDSHDQERFVKHRPTDDGHLLLHGHVHERWRVHDRQVNVGVDVWDFRPISDDQILAALEQAPTVGARP